MNIQHLHYFVVLAEHKHFARAAQACHVTQPTLSAGIAKLEQELQVQLVLRDKQFIGLTDFGTQLLNSADKILAEQRNLKQQIQLATTGLSGQLKLAVVPQCSVEIMPKIKLFQQLYPQVRVQLHVMTNKQICTALKENAIELGVGFTDELFHFPQLQSFKFSNCQRQLAIVYHQSFTKEGPKQAVLTQSKSLTLTDIKNMPMCLLSQTMQFRQTIDRELEHLGIDLNCVFETESLHHLINAVVHCIGVAIVSLNSAKTICDANSLNYCVLQDITINETGLITRRKHQTVIAEKFIEMLQIRKEIGSEPAK
ncbi:LysR family transcriptional regulator [Catenovulum agarivorans DS-2]|uniref:LysR family transcriptional regulator n=1 Tax=Catenovulum agarivorans DS-2 TaxID=1328313 RepID=W7QCX0_9ALTE|nr:LysR family transcriptional regulator [Catenovulum agarivorans]EWH10739.1 LysR family transcriptional regulator [Catenovulum agarivorans DS-2]